jgi:uncharacterized protein YecE (DUF72 family)
MTTRFHIGAKELQGSLTAYAKRFDLLEVRADTKLPALPALKRWRKSVPPHFDFAIVGGPHLSLLKPGAQLEADLETTIAAISALQARCFVLQTPVDVTPGAVSRDRMARLLDRLPRDATHVIWEPRGVWEVEDAAAAAKKWGVVLGVDPARDNVPDGPVSYGRLRSLGETRSFGASALQRIVDKIGERRDAYLVIETSSALSECKELRRLAQTTKQRGGAAKGMVIRPRGASKTLKNPSVLKVRDDEQE